MKINKIILPDHLKDLMTGEKYFDCYDYEMVDSTNKLAWKLWEENIKRSFAVTAKVQTRGKGQRGNQWRSYEGGLYLSLGLTINLAISNINKITLFTIWGIVDQLQKLKIPVKIKWLNDLMLNNAKLGGILTETKIQKQLINQVVIGIGINYQNIVPQSAISLTQWQEKNKFYPIYDLEKLKEIVILGVLNGYQILNDRGIKPIITDYNNWFDSINENVIIASQHQGKIRGINEQGDLQVELSSLGAKTQISCSPQQYRLSYSKQNNYYDLQKLVEN